MSAEHSPRVPGDGRLAIARPADPAGGGVPLTPVGPQP